MLRLSDIALWRAPWCELLKEWVRQGGPRRKWEALLKLTGGLRVHDALQLLDSLLKAGLVEVMERREQNRWQPWRMDSEILSGLKRKKALTENDKDRLNRLLLQPMSETLRELAAWMLENGEKGEQEGIVF